MGKIYLRPHHIETLVDFATTGWTEAYKNKIAKRYGDIFAEQMMEFLKELTNNPHKQIEIISEIDSLCKYGVGCFHKRDCEKGKGMQKIKLQDTMAMKKFNINIGEPYTLDNILNC